MSNIDLFFLALLFFAGVILYMRLKNKITDLLTGFARPDDRLNEFSTLLPVIDKSKCTGCSLCAESCPENVLGMIRGKAVVIDRKACLGHGACFQACQFNAISLEAGKLKRGAELPHVYENFESVTRGVFIAGEAGGMGILENVAEQAIKAVENIVRSLRTDLQPEYDLVIAGAGTAGIAAALTAKKHNLRFVVIEQDMIGSAFLEEPLKKFSGNAILNLPLAGTVCIKNWTGKQIANFLTNVILRYRIPVQVNCKITSFSKQNGGFNVFTSDDKVFNTAFVLLATGRQGMATQAYIPGEKLRKVLHGFSDFDTLAGRKVFVTGPVMKAVRSALLLADKNEVTLSCPEEILDNISPLMSKNLGTAVLKGKIRILFRTKLLRIEENYVTLRSMKGNLKIDNDLVCIYDQKESAGELIHADQEVYDEVLIT